MDEQTLRIVKASVISADDGTGLSKTIEEDPFSSIAHNILPPPLPFSKLANFPNMSTVLPQCLDAMGINISGMGFDLVPNLKPEDDSYKRYESEIKDEYDRLTEWFEWLDEIAEFSWSSLCRYTRIEQELFGNAAWQIVENSLANIEKGLCPILEITLIPAKDFRYTRKDADYRIAKYPYLKDQEYIDIALKRRFRRLVQEVEGKYIYFKEFLDERSIDPTTGLEKALPLPEQANRYIPFKVFNSAAEPYGYPRWGGTIISVGYSRKAETVLYNFFDDNAVPPLAILVSGGTLADGAVERIKEYLKDIKGEKSHHTVLVLEAEGGGGAISGLQGPGSAKVEINALNEAVFDVDKFRNLNKDADDKTRSQFRLPPILVGLSSDYTRATALESLSAAESQLFKPERDEFDHIINTTIMLKFRARFHKYRSRKPDINEKGLGTLIYQLSQVLAITPNEARLVVSKLLGVPLPPYQKDALQGTGGNMPGPLVLAGAKAAAPSPLEKTEYDNSSIEEIAKWITKLRETLKKQITE